MAYDYSGRFANVKFKNQHCVLEMEIDSPIGIRQFVKCGLYRGVIFKYWGSFLTS